MRGALLSAVCSVAAALCAAPVWAQQSGMFKDWIVGCDEVRHCVAIGTSPVDADNHASLSLARGGRGSDRVERVLIAVDAELEPGLRTTISADGEALGTLVAERVEDLDSEGNLLYVSRDPALIASLLAALRMAQTLELVHAGTTYRISLAGASAALLWIDEQQARLDTVSAFVRKGSKADDTVRPPRAPAPIRAAIDPTAAELDPRAAAALAAPLRAGLPPDVCEEPNPDSALLDRAWRLDGEHQLLAISCYSGAYNFTAYWYLIGRDGKATPLAFHEASDEVDGEGEINALVNGDFDPGRATLSAFYKGRGIGDCGEISEWVWNGRSLELASRLFMTDCRLVPWSLWPQLVKREVIGRPEP